MKLKKLIKDLDIVVGKGSKDIDITGLTNHSKSVGPGYLYIAKKGATFDGNDFIHDAILAGAAAVLTDFYNPFLENVVQLIGKNIPQLEAILANRYYQEPANEIYMIGFTGTNGKTTGSYLTWHLLNRLEPCGLIGTIEKRIGDYVLDGNLTTPDCISCQKTLREMIHRGAESVCMEVSSHALDQNRVDGILFDVAVFTNLTPEHLDYHKNMDEYAQAKLRIFSKLKPNGYGLINRDDPLASSCMERCSGGYITYGIDHECDIRAIDIEYSLEGTNFTVKTESFEWKITTPFLGKFNVYNALAAIAIGWKRGMQVDAIQEALAHPPMIRGRMERITFGNKTVFVDFAHTDDGLKVVLDCLKGVAKGKIITVFGCGGERDPFKRPRMAAVAQEFSDMAIVTNDNPRGENPEDIARQIIAGFTERKFQVILDRREAIRAGIDAMSDGDILLVAGKGHETVQLMGGKSIEFDDVKVAKELLDVLV